MSKNIFLEEVAFMLQTILSKPSFIIPASKWSVKPLFKALTQGLHKIQDSPLFKGKVLLSY